MNPLGKVAIVTGASSGVGAETAVQLAELGASVVINYANTLAGAEETLRRVEAAGAKGVICQADVSDEAQCRHLVETAVAEFGGVDILVNNAGTTTYVPHKELNNLSDEIWERTLGTNLMGPFYMTRAVVPELIKRGGGEVVMTSSVAGLTSNGSSMAYCCSKAALNSMTRNLAKALGEHNIRVNAICPGLIDGRWAAEGWGEAWEDIKVLVEGQTPLSVIATPADVAQSLLSVITGTDVMTGQIITLDGGFTIN
ncbi:SDR family NAD(P)-dependent oxidoreductase [Parahalioglobus pacificus]|uniref:3-oxoacyl-ACP reductase n=1 Tax=Parahalioglobus pacificus TaxID=930806 RepID=A0A918XEX7_9GAMM|nr:SDR family oxidoreductase [Halioglobus pacificus]NQY02762.1 SDR family oxidoreductase [Halieaceae bacterium]GHD27496.1 3-oxoacyl-ACP reductase [Halioglobus pacificus]